MHDLILWLVLGLRIAHVGPNEETPGARSERLHSIAADIAAHSEKLPGYNAEDSVLLALATAYHETGFALDADTGPCYREGGYKSRCDHGRSMCIFQIQGLKQWPTRARCVAMGTGAMRQSLKRCAHLPERERLAGLSGSCDRGRKGSREIFAIYDSLRAKKARRNAP
jgi:hypothetical protein